MDFSEKLKQIRKSEGKPLLGYYDKFCWVCFTKYQGKPCFLHSICDILTIENLFLY